MFILLAYVYAVQTYIYINIFLEQVSGVRDTNWTDLSVAVSARNGLENEVSRALRKAS